MADAIRINAIFDVQDAQREGERAGEQFTRGFQNATRGLEPARDLVKGIRESVTTGMGEALERARRSLRAFGDQARTVGTALTASITAPLLAIGAAVIKVGVEYESSLNTLQAVTRATTQEMAAASAVAKQLGADITLPATSAADAAKAMTELAKGGLSVQQAMDAARGTLQLAAAAQIKEAEAAEITANALDSFKLEAREAGRVADLLAAASNASSAEITDFALSLQQSSASAAALRIPIQDVVVAIGLLANAGIKGSDAGTSLKTALTALAAPTDKAAAAMKALGVNAFDSQGKLLPLREVVGQFSDAFGKLSDQQKLQAANTIFGSDAMRAALIVFGGGVEQFDKLSAAVGQQGAAAELAAAKTKGLGGAYESLKSQLETGAIIAFEKLKGPLEQVVRFTADGVTKVIDFIEKLNATNPELTKAALIFAGIAAAVGPVTLVIAGLATALGTIGAPLLAAAAAVTVAAAAISAAWSTNFLGIRDVTYQVVGEVSKFAREQLGVVVAFFKENLPILKEAVANVLAAVRAFWKENGDEITVIVRETWAIIKTVVSTAIKTVLDVIKLAAQLINGDWSAAWDTFKGIVSRAIDAVASVLQNLENRVVAGFKFLGNSLLQIGTAIKGALLALGTNIVTGIIEGMKSKTTEFYNTVKGIVTGGINVAKTVLGIQSPSRVFFGIGQNVGEGYALGIEASKTRIQKAIDTTIKASIVELPDPLEIFSQLRKTEREREQLFTETTSRLVPIGIDPTGLGVESLKGILPVLEEIPPPLFEATEAMRQFGNATEAAQRQVTPLENAFKNLFDRFTGFASRGIEKLTSKLGAFGSFANDILSDITGNIFQSLRTGLFGGQTRGANGQIGARTGGLLGSLLGLGGQTANAAGVGGFLTPGFNPNGGSGFSIQNLVSGGGFFGQLSAPPSVTAPGGFNPIIQGDFGAGGAGLSGGTGLLGNLKALLGTGPGGLLQGVGFGLQKGSATGSFAQGLPLLGLSLGSQLGGGGLGSIIGGAGGALLGIGATAAPAFLSTGIFASGGALGGLGSAATALFSNPITAIIGGALLAGAFFLGRAKQRKKDEQTSGDWLQQAVDSIFELRDSVKNDQVQGDQVKQIFENEVMATFIAQINTIKTKSVRESRLQNQTRDLRALFEKEVSPEIEAQKLRIKTGAFGGRNIIPEFAHGGIVPGRDRGVDEVLVLARPQEMYIPLEKQFQIQQMAGFNVFAAAGIPGANQLGAPPIPTSAPIQGMNTGGIVAPFIAPGPSRSEGAVTITVESVEVVIDPERAGEIVFHGVQTSRGQSGLSKGIRKMRTFGDF